MDDEFEYEVRHRAYELWVAGGRPDGEHQQFWEAAERELRARRLAEGVDVPPQRPGDAG